MNDEQIINIILTNENVNGDAIDLVRARGCKSFVMSI